MLQVCRQRTFRVLTNAESDFRKFILNKKDIPIWHVFQININQTNQVALLAYYDVLYFAD